MKSAGRSDGVVGGCIFGRAFALTLSLCGTDLNGYCIHCGPNSYMNSDYKSTLRQKYALSGRKFGFDFSRPNCTSCNSTQRTTAADMSSSVVFVHPPELICRFSQPITFSTAPQEEREEERGKDLFLSLSLCERCGVYVHTYFPSGKGGREEAS